MLALGMFTMVSFAQDATTPDVSKKLKSKLKHVTLDSEVKSKASESSTLPTVKATEVKSAKLKSKLMKPAVEK